jgi:hypothetical protein
MNENIKAGADIHAGDGGYRTSTHEAQAKFAQARNQSLARSRFCDLAIQADIWCDQNWHDESTYNLAWEDKFAELIVRDTIKLLHQEWYDLNNAPPVEGESARDVGIRVGRKSEVIALMSKVSKHFGVEE